MFTLVTDCEEPVGLYDTSYAVMTPLGIAGSSHVIVILKKEGIDVMNTGPGTGIKRKNSDYNGSEVL